MTHFGNCSFGGNNLILCLIQLPATLLDFLAPSFTNSKILFKIQCFEEFFRQISP